VKIRIQTTVGIQSGQGVHFGTTDWIKGRTVQLRSPTDLETHEELTLKIELPDGSEWVLANARVMKTAPSGTDETTRALVRIIGMSPAHRGRLSEFLKEAQNGPLAEPKEPIRPIPLHEPTMDMSSDGRNLLVKWSDPRAFRRDWALHISRGRLPAGGTPPHRRAFMMCIMMPDGYVAKFPAEIGETLKDGWLVRFLVPHTAFNRMRGYAEDRKRRVV
jgi:hypothetical protein